MFRSDECYQLREIRGPVVRARSRPPSLVFEKKCRDRQVEVVHGRQKTPEAELLAVVLATEMRTTKRQRGTTVVGTDSTSLPAVNVLGMVSGIIIAPTRRRTEEVCLLMAKLLGNG